MIRWRPMSTKRSYADGCAAAHALVQGEIDEVRLPRTRERIVDMHGVERDPRRTVHRIERIRTHPYDVAGARGAESLGEGQVAA